MSFRFYGGIDFSGAREPLANLWTAVGEERGGKLHVRWLQPHPFRDDLRYYVAGGWRKAGGVDDAARILWGADFPFGIPGGAAAQIADGRRVSWSGTAGWIADRPADEVRDGLPAFAKAPRATDTGGALAPFDLRLYRQTVEGIRWLHALRDEVDLSFPPILPAEGASTTLIEVYPSGAAKEIGMKGGRLPSRPGEVRARPAALRTFMTFEHPSLEAMACTLEDARDACMAALVAFLCRDDLDQPHRLARAAPETLALEGWIYRPPAAIG